MREVLEWGRIFQISGPDISEISGDTFRPDYPACQDPDYPA
jgi:hypothetical protein